MEQEVLSALYQALGKSHGSVLSPEDVSVLYRNIFHFSSSSGEAKAAIKKITASCDSRWSCVGEKVLDVLLEMEKEREKKEMLFWDLQLLNAGRLHHHVMNYLHKNTKTRPSFGSGSPQTSSDEIKHIQFCEKRKNTRKIKKAARLRWARLACEGVYSVLSGQTREGVHSVLSGQTCEGVHSMLSGQTCDVPNTTWGVVSESDLLLLLEVKYDVVTHFLYSEMLQDHHGEEVWDAMSSWQRDEEMEKLEELVEEALMSHDMLKMAELPGAFRLYRFPGPENSSSSCSCSAVSFLNDVHESRQRERSTLSVLIQRLHKDSLSLVGLNIWLATVRAQRQRNSFQASMFAQQSWENWPNVNNPNKAEQLSLLLYSRKDEEKPELEESLQQTVMELMVLSQQQEINQLLMMVKKQENDDGDERRTLSLEHVQTHEKTLIKRETPLGSEVQLLVSNLMNLHQIQTLDLLKALSDKDGSRLRSLKDGYVSEIQTQNFKNLKKLLLSDIEPSKIYYQQDGAHTRPDTNQTQSLREETSGVKTSHTRPDTNQNQETSGAKTSQTRPDTNQNQETSGAKTSQTRPDTNQNQETSGAKTSQTRPDTNQNQETSGAKTSQTRPDTNQTQRDETSGAKTSQTRPDTNQTQRDETSGAQTHRKEICSGCGAVMEDLLYLESEEEKQESLITLAWSKPSDEDLVTDHELQTTTDQREDVQSQTQIQTEPQTHREQVCLEPSPQLIKEHQPPEWEASPDRDVQTESLRRIHPHLLAEIPELDPNVEDVCVGEAVNLVRDVSEDEMFPQMKDLKDPPDTEDLCDWKTTALRGSSLTVSAVEREKTMRSLVDMQRRFEKKHQRDRERTLLRVQERLSIVQNRKTEKDLLGLKHTDRLKNLTHDLPKEDLHQQKNIVRERLEKLRRERSIIMQTKRERNTSGFKELLSPVVLHSETEDGVDWDTQV